MAHSRVRRRVAERHAIREAVEPGSRLYTDAWVGYVGLSGEYDHDVLTTRTLKGTYVAVSPVHLDRYLDEQAMRFNTRQDTDGSRFGKLMAQTPNKRLTYKLLTNGN